MRRLHTPVLMAGLVVVPAGSATAEPWQGIWTADPAWCVNAGRIGSVTPAPVALTAAEFLGYENSCELSRVEDTGLNAWVIDMACQSEGGIYDERRVVMVAGDDMYMWFGTQAPVHFTRCAS